MSTDMSRLERIVRFAIAHRWLMLSLTLAVAARGCLELHAPADRCDAGHHQRPGADQHRGAGLFAAGSGAAHHVPDRDCAGRIAESRLHALAFAVRAFAGHGRLRRRHRHLLRAPAGRRAHRPGEVAASAGLEPELGPDRDRPGRDLPVHGDGGSGGAPPDGKPWTSMDLRIASRLGGASATAQHARRHRGQRHRRLCAAYPRHAGSGAAAGVWVHAR